jgi:MFS family permease
LKNDTTVIKIKMTKLSLLKKGVHLMNRTLLQNRTYKALISAQAISNLGDWFNILGLMALVGLKWHGTPLDVSIVMLMFSVPSILFGSFAGTLADRLDRKCLMIFSDLVRSALIVGIVFATNLIEIYCLVALLSLFSSLFSPAKQGKLKEIVPDEHMQSAVATSQLINNGAKIIGPILGGILLAAVSINWAFYLDAISFLLSGFLLLFLPKTPDRAIQTDIKGSVQKKTRFFHQLFDGFTYLKTTPSLLVGLVVFSLVLFVLQISDSQFIILFRELKTSSINVLGWVMAGSGLGVVLSSIYLNKKVIRSFMTVLSLGSSVIGLGYIFLSSCIHLPIIWIEVLFPAAGVIVGFCFGLALIPFEVMVQKMTPEAYTGRVFGTIDSLTTLSTILGTTLGGVLSQVLGVHFTYDLAGGLLVVVGLVVYSIRKTLERGNTNAESQSGAL